MRYGYTGGDPVNRVDPTGLATFSTYAKQTATDVLIVGAVLYAVGHLFYFDEMQGFGEQLIDEAAEGLVGVAALPAVFREFFENQPGGDNNPDPKPDPNPRPRPGDPPPPPIDGDEDDCPPKRKEDLTPAEVSIFQGDDAAARRVASEIETRYQISPLAIAQEYKRTCNGDFLAEIDIIYPNAYVEVKNASRITGQSKQYRNYNYYAVNPSGMPSIYYNEQGLNDNNRRTLISTGWLPADSLEELVSYLR